MSLGHNGPALVVAITAVACFVAGVMLLLHTADEKDRRTLRLVGAVLLLLLAFGLGLCSALLGSLG